MLMRCLDIKQKREQKMLNKSQSPSVSEQSQFKKGMTLEQYMSQANFEKPQGDSLDESIEDNLYDSCKEAQKDQIYQKKRNYKIDQIDQESIEDSKDYHGHKDTLETPGFQQIDKDDFLGEENQLGKAIKNRNNSISMSTAITFKCHHSHQDNNNFRFKRLSVSPQKKKVEAPSMLPGASITLYGSKFGQSPPVKPKQMPEMLTFYGKLHLEGEEALKRKSSVKETDLKQKFKKKTQYELSKMIPLQGMRGGLGYKTGYPDLKVEGFGDRKNKFI